MFGFIWCISVFRLVDCPSRYSNPTKYWMNATRPSYRLGDCVKLNTDCGYPFDSLARRYASKSGGALSNVTLLAQLVTQMSCPHPPDDNLVIHLRLGDVIEVSQTPVAQMLTHGGRTCEGIRKRHQII